jgi:hypothetical protein
MCACGGEPGTREHFFLYGPLYATPRATLSASLRIALSSAAIFMPTNQENALHILADNLSAVQRPIDPRPSPGQTIRLAIRNSLISMEETHPQVRVVVHWVPGHIGIDGNEEADELAKSAVEEAGRALAKSTTAHEKRAKARRGLRAMAFDPKAVSESSSSDGGDSEYEEGGRRGDLAMTTRRIAARAPSTQDRDLGDGRLGGGWELPRSVSAIWASYRAALHQQWAKEWSAATTGAGLRAIARSPPGPSFSRFHAQLTRRQSTLLSRLRTGVCDLGAYRAHFDPDKELCECGEVESREHFLLLCPLYAAPRATLLSELRKPTLPPIAFLLSDPSATKATLRFLANSGRFDSLYSPLADPPLSG